MKNIQRTSLTIYNLIKQEKIRQRETIPLIASENFASGAVLEALGSCLSNKYSEGYPGKRYYPGNKYCDAIEEEAQKLALKMFRLKKGWHANVQPYSGSPANMEIYFALLEPGDAIMGMRLAEGGHLTHGHKVSLSGKIFRSIQYGLNKDSHLIDYKWAEKLALKHKPKLIICGATAYSRIIDFKKFKNIAKKVNAFLVADISHIAGLVVAKVHPSPFLYADVVMTTTHKTLRGPRGAIILCKDEFRERINKAVFPGMQGGPHNATTAAMAICFKEALSNSFVKYQKQIIKNAKALSKELAKKGFNIVSGGTDNHLFLVDLKSKGVSGQEAEKRLESAGIIVNRNTVPGDKSPFNPSGIRIGTPAATTLGMKEREMKKISEWIDKIIADSSNISKVKKEVGDLRKNFRSYS